MKIATLTAAAFGTALLAGSALAQARMDMNADGMYSMEELMAAFPDMNQETFATADTDSDGLLSTEELAAAQADGLIPATEG